MGLTPLPPRVWEVVVAVVGWGLVGVDIEGVLWGDREIVVGLLLGAPISDEDDDDEEELLVVTL